MFKTFNMGLGLILAVNSEQEDLILKELDKRGQKAYKIGRIEKGKRGVNLQ